MILFYFLPSVIELNSIQWLSIYVPYSKSLNIFMSVRLTTYFKWPFLLWNIEGKFTTIAITDFIYLLPILYKMLNYFGNHREYNKVLYTSVVQSLSLVCLFVTPWTAACQASLSFTISQSLLKLMSIELVMPFNHLILCYPLLCLPSVFLSIRVSSHPMAKYWSFSFSISHSKGYSRLISFWMDWFDLLAVQGTLKSLPPRVKSINSLVLSLLYGPALTFVHDYWKNLALTMWTFVNKQMSLLFNMSLLFI